MSDIGVRELKTRASEIVQEVEKRQTRYTIARRGRPVAVIIPIEKPRAQVSTENSAWAELLRLGKEIARGWQAPQSSVEILSETRR
ncbi:MAG: type II toxin-antitoxin system Phd/YefM family antitoxin [Anaerolineales bacterium]|nr:type II toxin-antitoxin system Phd/YefM family antitoxin [Anaerolineales bacterium]